MRQRVARANLQNAAVLQIDAGRAGIAENFERPAGKDDDLIGRTAGHDLQAAVADLARGIGAINNFSTVDRRAACRTAVLDRLPAAAADCGASDRAAVENIQKAAAADDGVAGDAAAVIKRKHAVGFIRFDGAGHFQRDSCADGKARELVAAPDFEGGATLQRVGRAGAVEQFQRAAAIDGRIERSPFGLDNLASAIDRRKSGCPGLVYVLGAAFDFCVFCRSIDGEAAPHDILLAAGERGRDGRTVRLIPDELKASVFDRGPDRHAVCGVADNLLTAGGDCGVRRRPVAAVADILPTTALNRRADGDAGGAIADCLGASNCSVDGRAGGTGADILKASGFDSGADGNAVIRLPDNLHAAGLDRRVYCRPGSTPSDNLVAASLNGRIDRSACVDPFMPIAADAGAVDFAAAVDIDHAAGADEG